MKNILFIMILACGLLVSADQASDKIQDACLHDQSLDICKQMQFFKNRLEQVGNKYSEDILKASGHPELITTTAILTKSIVEQKIEINSGYKPLGSPRLDLMPNKTEVSINFSF